MTDPTTPAANEPGAHSRVSRARIISNTLSSAGAYLLYLPVNLVVSSFVVHRIGIGAFGIWATLTTVLNFASLLNLGINTPIVKYVAEYVAIGKRAGVNGLLSTAMVLYFVVSGAFVAVMLLSGGWVLTHLFHTQAHDQMIFQLYVVVLVGFMLSLTFSVLLSLIQGLQRADLAARLALFVNLFGSGVTVAALLAGMGVQGLALSWAVSTVLTIAGTWVIGKRLFPALTLNPLLFRLSLLKSILRFSSRVQVTTLTLALNDQVDQILIAYALGQSMLGYYALASRVATAIRPVSFAVMAGILPAASDLSASGHNERLRSLLFRSSRYIAIIDLAMCGAIGALAYPMVHAWLGSGYGRVAATLAIIMVGYAVWLPTQPLSDTLNGVGKPEVRMRADLTFLIIHAPLSVLLIWRFGYFGTVVGTLIALTSTRLYFYVAGTRALHVRLNEFVQSSFLQPAVAVLLAATAVIAIQFAGAPVSIPGLVLEGAVFLVVYVGYIAKFGLDSFDRDLVRGSLLRPAESLFKRVLRV